MLKSFLVLNQTRMTTFKNKGQKIKQLDKGEDILHLKLNHRDASLITLYLKILGINIKRIG